MCRFIRNHPIKSIFLLLVLLSFIHLSHKFFLTNFKQYTLDYTHSFVITAKNDTEYILTNVTVSKPKEHIPKIINNTGNNLQICKVNMSSLKPSIPVNQTASDIRVMEEKPWAAGLNEGLWSPVNCSTKHKVAFIIPYRNREEHLKILLNHMHPFLQKQQLSYGIFVIEQAAGTTFNRAALFNVGVNESQKISSIDFDCFIFHDVDLLPTNENNFYTCDSSPLHMSVAIDKFNYKLPYQAIFGGAVALSRQHLQLVNGFSNIFFGWGGEDDDMSSRLSFKSLSIHRYPMSVARYVMVKHTIDKGNAVNPLRFKLLSTSKARQDKDGLSSLTYKVVPNSQNANKLYRHITVQFPEKDMLKKWNI